MKRLLTFSISLLCAVAISAQTLMKIEVKDATELKTQNGYVTLPANVVKNITFETTKVDTTLTLTTANVTETSATIRFNLAPTGIAVSKYVVKYGKKGEFDLNNIDNMKEASASGGASVTLSGLQPNTEYSYWAYVELADGNLVMGTSVANFMTLEQQVIDLIIQFNSIWASYTKAYVELVITGEQLRNGEYGLYCSTDQSLLGTSETLVFNSTIVYDDGAFVTRDLEDLEDDKIYYLKAYVKAPDGRSKEVSGTFTTRKALNFEEPTPVDLGLSVKWASFNLGANSESEYGGYFGWGDATGEETRFGSSYYAPGVRNTGIRGNADYDIAAAKLGGYWRLPTPEEVLELKQCNPTRTTVNGVAGVQLTGIGSKKDNKIFIPFAGYSQELEQYFQGGKYAYLWTDSIDQMGNAFYVEFMPSDGVWKYQSQNKSYLTTIRAVWDDGTRPEPEPEPEPVPDPSKMAVEGTENNPTTGAIPQDGVDMGNGVRWARWNVGCMTATGGIGRYYAWGATETQTSYTQADYASNDYYNKTREEIEGGMIDAEHDVATQLWGEDWRMPTEDDFSDLFNNCQRTWTTENGVYGYRFTSNINGNSLFIPAAGYQIDEDIVDKGEAGRYWTSYALFTKDAKLNREYASHFYFHHGSVDPQISGFGRYQGLQIRPVKKK